jgi:MYXO-CTERM domain-containing protein
MAFVRIGLNVAGDGWAHQLLVAGPQSDCAAHPPTRIDAPSQLGAADWLYFFPRFSPDGKRLAVLALGATGTGNVEKLFTVGVDGTGFRVVRTFPTSSDQIVPPTWIDNATLAWREFTGTGSSPPFRIVSAADAAGAGDTSAMTVIDCPASMPFTGLSQFEAVDATTFVFAASTIAGSGSAPGLTNLYRVPAGSCTAANKLTNETSAGHFSGDFSLSPDGKTVVFASTIGSAPATVSGGQLTDIFVVPVDGSAAPRRVAGDPMFIDAGPRFVAGGRQIVWTRLGVVPMDGGSGADLPQSSALMLANLDGTNVRTLVDVTARAGETHMAIGGLNMGNSCAVGGGAASAGGMAVLAVVVLAGLARRRRGATSRT